MNSFDLIYAYCISLTYSKLHTYVPYNWHLCLLFFIKLLKSLPDVFFYCLEVYIVNREWLLMRNFHTWLDFYSHLFTILEAGTYIFQFWWLITFTHFSFADNPSQLQEELNLTKNNNKSSTDCLLNTAGTVNNGIHRKRKESTVGPEALLLWLTKQVESYENVVISDMTVSFQNGLALCAIIHR